MPLPAFLPILLKALPAIAATVASAASAFSDASGPAQVGAPAPAPIPSPPSNFKPISPLGNNFFDTVQSIQGSAPQNTSIESLIGQQGQPLAPQVTAQDQGNPISSIVNALPGVDQNILGALGQEGGQSGIGGKVGDFFGNLDQNLESPAKLLGLALLSQIDPRLAQAGLFAGGLFGKNKLF